jgi:Flp pilus assembly protein TadD
MRDCGAFARTVDEIRDGRTALALARRACRLSETPVASYLDTLAAAYAENGDFEHAVKSQEEALPLEWSEERIDAFRQRLSLYQQSKPYRDE